MKPLHETLARVEHILTAGERKTIYKIISIAFERLKATMPAEKRRDGPPDESGAKGYRMSDEGRRMLEAIEGRRNTAYDDGFGGMTIGVGHLIDMEKEAHLLTATLTDDEVDALLDSDLQDTYRALRVYVRRGNLKQCEIDALCSWTFNLGSGNLSCSTLLKRINEGDTGGASREILRWNKARDPETGELMVVDGLTRRRRAERAMFMGLRWRDEWYGLRPVGTSG